MTCADGVVAIGTTDVCCFSLDSLPNRKIQTMLPVDHHMALDCRGFAALKYIDPSAVENAVLMLGPCS